MEPGVNAGPMERVPAVRQPLDELPVLVLAEAHRALLQAPRVRGVLLRQYPGLGALCLFQPTNGFLGDLQPFSLGAEHLLGEEPQQSGVHRRHTAGSPLGLRVHQSPSVVWGRYAWRCIPMTGT